MSALELLVGLVPPAVVGLLWKLHVASIERRAEEWKKLYEKEEADHAKTLGKVEKLLSGRPLTESSRPPGSSSTKTPTSVST